MKVYVAGKWEAKAAVREVMAALRAEGHIITFDWTFSTGMPPTENALADMNGVKAADALVAVMPDITLPYRGTFTEIGAAINDGKPVYMVGYEQWVYADEDREEGGTPFIFLYHPLVCSFNRFPDKAVVAAVGAL